VRRIGRSGFTLLEVLVSTVVLVVLVGLALGALSETSQPVIEGSVRSYLTTQGDAVLGQLDRELSSGSYTGASQVVGNWTYSGTNVGGGTFTADGAGGTSTRCPAIQFQPITGWDTTNQVALTGATVTYAFIADGSNLKLVRISNGLAVDVLTDIVATSTDTDELAKFEQVGFTGTPAQQAQLEVRFTVARKVDQTTTVRMTFAKTITLRNLMS
jgi:prepilin-type N-terminal cleavage/methylation domain-containing protein